MTKTDNIHVSSDARRILDYLSARGIDIASIYDIFNIEVCCSLWWPNHIEMVIDRCLTGNNVYKKLNRARDQGWEYFERPIRKLLPKRPGAQRNDREIVNEDDIVVGWSVKVYSMIANLLLISDMDRREVNLLLYKVPHLCTSTIEILDAIEICKNTSRGSRNIYYLNGVLKKTRQRKDAIKKEIESSRNDEIINDKNTKKMSSGIIKDIEESWEEGSSDINVDKALRKYAEET